MLSIFEPRPAPATVPAVRPREPFGTTPDPQLLYGSRTFLSTLDEVSEGLRRREGLIVVTGEPGTGKTLLCRTLISRFANRVLPSVVLDPCVTIEELLTHILREFGVIRGAAAPESRHELMALLQRFLTSLIPLHAHAVVIVDEAQHFDDAMLEQIRLLLNYESDDSKLLQIVLVGTPVLDERCAAPEMRHFAQRIARRCRLAPLSAGEVAEYIQYRLAAATSESELWIDLESGTMDRACSPGAPAVEFTTTAMRAIAGRSRGIPRVINRLCSRSLGIACQRGVTTVDRGIVRAAAKQGDFRTPPMIVPAPRLVAVAAGLLVIVLAPVTWLFASQLARATPPGIPAQGQSPRGESPGLRSTGDASTVERLGSVQAFSIRVASFRSASGAASVAAQLQADELPALASTAGGGWHVVEVGPYVSQDDARNVRRALAAEGFPDAALVPPATHTAVAATPDPGTAKVLVASAGSRQSLVFDLGEVPSQVATQRLSATELVMDTGPFRTPVADRVIQAPGGGTTVERVLLQGVTTEDGGHGLRARVLFRQETHSRVRVTGRFLYLDLLQPGAQIPARPAPRAAMGPRPAADRVSDDEVSNAGMKDAMERFARIQPFLASAAAAPKPDVLEALTTTLADLRQSVEHVGASADVAAARQLLLSAVTLATSAMDPSFEGDRVARAQQAIAAYGAASAQITF